MIYDVIMGELFMREAAGDVEIIVVAIWENVSKLMPATHIILFGYHLLSVCISNLVGRRPVRD
jgi:hypothetical protein